jgi:hypothetical protein
MISNIFHTTFLHKPMAYLDPGTGSLVTQMVIAGLLGVGIFLRAFWKKIFKKKNPPVDATPTPEVEEPHIDDPFDGQQ